MTKKNFEVVGMHCVSCTRAIEDAIKKLDGVSDANINYDTKECEVCFDDTITNIDKISGAVSDIGYTLVDKNG